MKKKLSMMFFFLWIAQVAFCDEAPKALNLDCFRTPEASAFKKYGEESVNEYTGTADISVPLYTIKSKDVEIPIVLRYDASGIKVEQEASWVGLGWNLMVGGCINYVCAGGHDMYGTPEIENSVWTEYLTSEFSPWTGGIILGTMESVSGPVARNRSLYYTYNANENSNWMNKLNMPQNFVYSYIENFDGLIKGMNDYINWGHGERDFYSVNVMGKSFMFFIDPLTLKAFNIGKAGEDFKVIPTYYSNVQNGIGNQPDVSKWTITDSDGYIYEFAVGDKFHVDHRTNFYYSSCWYLTKLQTPLGETVYFEYSSLDKQPRLNLVESHEIPFFHEGGAFCCRNVSQQKYTHFLDNENDNMNVTSHYLSKIKTGNQVVSFLTSGSNECSGRKLDEILIKTNDNDSTLIKTIKLSYGSFGFSNVGGNYAPNDRSNQSENRLKLNNVKEIASTDTLTTSFSYNEAINLPSKRSCAQDYWGYFNGKENNVSGRGNSLLPKPSKFMTSRNSNEIEKLGVTFGADRFTHGEFMKAAILNKVIYPTGGYTTYEYEANSINTPDYTLSENYRNNQYDVNINQSYSCSNTPLGYTESGTRWYEFTISNESTCDLLLTASGEPGVLGKRLYIEMRKWNENTRSYDLFQEKDIIFQSYNNPTPILQNLTLSEGRYYIGTTLYDHGHNQFGYTWFLQGWYNSTIRPGNSFPIECGGLRIKQINNYDQDNSLINYTTYDYSGGVLLYKIETIDYAQKYNYRPDSDPVNGNFAWRKHDIGVYTITTGHSKMPAFFKSCNPGIVGYSNVIRRRYDANNNLEKQIISSYTNNAPTNTYDLDYYTVLSNGLLQRQEIYDGNTIVSKTKNYYSSFPHPFRVCRINTKS